MNLSKQYINAIVDTLEIEHNKKYKKEETDEDGLTKEEEAALKVKTKRIRGILNKLPKDVKDFLESDEGGQYFWNKKVQSEAETLENLRQAYIDKKIYDKANGEAAKRLKSGKPNPAIFDRDEVSRKVVLLVIECKTLDELSKKLGVKLTK